MSTQRYIALAALLWLACLPGRTLAQVRADARVNSTSAVVGDQIQLQLEVRSPKSIELGEPQFRGLDTMQQLELLATSPWDSTREDGARLYRKAYTLTAWDTGSYYLPRLEVPYAGGGTTQMVVTPRAIPVEVGIMPVDTAQLAPIKPIISTPGFSLRWWQLLLLGLGLILLIVLVIAWRRWVQRAGPEIPKVETDPRMPHEIALDQLNELQATDLLERGEEKEFQSRLTHILREYLEGRFGIRALEQTTDQILRQLDGIGLDPERVAVLRKLLPMADLVKFAKAKPPREFHTDALRDVRSWIEYTIPQVNETEEEE